MEKRATGNCGALVLFYGPTKRARTALGFDRKLLEKQIELDNQRAKVVLHQCIYEDKEKVSFFQEMGRNASADLRN
jgi:hypothetical protein